MNFLIYLKNGGSGNTKIPDGYYLLYNFKNSRPKQSGIREIDITRFELDGAHKVREGKDL